MEPPHPAADGPEDEERTVFDLPEVAGSGGELPAAEPADAGAAGIEDFEALDAEAERLAAAPSAESPSMAARGRPRLPRPQRGSLPSPRAFVSVGLGAFASILAASLLFGSADPSAPVPPASEQPAAELSQRPSAPDPQRRAAAERAPAERPGRGRETTAAGSGGADAERPGPTLTPPARPASDPTPAPPPPAPATPATPSPEPPRGASRAEAAREFDIP